MFPETSVDFQRTARRYIRVDRTLLNSRRLREETPLFFVLLCFLRTYNIVGARGSVVGCYATSRKVAGSISGQDTGFFN
jgi:hypothetical protein